MEIKLEIIDKIYDKLINEFELSNDDIHNIINNSLKDSSIYF